MTDWVLTVPLDRWTVENQIYTNVNTEVRLQILIIGHVTEATTRGAVNGG